MPNAQTQVTSPSRNAKPDTASPEAAIRDLVAEWLHAVRAGDLDRIMSHYAGHVVAFDAVAAVQFKGMAAYRDHWQACMAMCPGHAVFELHELGIAASGDVGFAHWLCRCGTVEQGIEKTSWMRTTQCLRRLHGKWLIVHEHFSAPFDMASGKVLFEATP